MATKKEKAPKKGKEKAPKGKTAPVAVNGKAKLTPEEKAERAKRRKEALKNRPDGQRENSKTIDIIPGENGTKVLVYAQPIRKFGVIITSVVVDADGNIISSSTTTLAGYRVKSKKGHGNLVLGAPGMGKGKDNSNDDDDDDDNDGDED